MKSECTVFEYIYRDAGNYKVYGAVLLKGKYSSESEDKIRCHLNDGQWFIAEQIGIPALFGQLWRYGGGPTEDDMPFHEFVSLREANESDISSLENFGSLSEFICGLESIVNRWDISLSGCEGYGEQIQ